QLPVQPRSADHIPLGFTKLYDDGLLGLVHHEGGGKQGEGHHHRQNHSHQPFHLASPLAAFRLPLSRPSRIFISGSGPTLSSCTMITWPISGRISAMVSR